MQGAIRSWRASSAKSDGSLMTAGKVSAVIGANYVAKVREKKRV